MISWIKQLFKGKQCSFCRKKANQPRYYMNEKGYDIIVCPLCVEYAERRAYHRK
jgi:hypothetical protein